MLRPIVEAAGYRVVSDADEAEADRRDPRGGVRDERSARGPHDPPSRRARSGVGRRTTASIATTAPALLMALKSASRRKALMSELLLIVTIAGERVALPAAAVESVVELDTLIPVPRAAPHVAGLSALRSRVLTVIDCMRSLELGVTDCSDGIREAAVVELDGHHYALIVDLVEDVVEALVRAGAGPRRHGRRAGNGCRQGMVETEAGPLLLVDIAALVGGLEATGCLSSSLPLAFKCAHKSQGGKHSHMKSCLIVDDSQGDPQGRPAHPRNARVRGRRSGRRARSAVALRSQDARRRPARLEHAGDERDGVPAHASPARHMRTSRRSSSAPPRTTWRTSARRSRPARTNM